jgi:hypothetical protein
LPCTHLWHRHLLYNTLPTAELRRFANLFEEYGYDVYEHYNLKLVQQHVADDDGQSEEARDTLKAREIFEQLRSKWFNLIEETLPMEIAERDAARLHWVSGLTKAIGPFLRATAREVLIRILERLPGGPPGIRLPSKW